MFKKTVVAIMCCTLIGLSFVMVGCSSTKSPAPADNSDQVVPADPAGSTPNGDSDHHTALSIVTTSLPEGVIGMAYSETLVASGGNGSYTWSTNSGTLPDGLSLDPATGVISGTPVKAGTHTFVAQVTDSLGANDTQYIPALLINSAPCITTKRLLSDGEVGAPYSQTFEAVGGGGGYIWFISGGSIPSGLSVDNTTGIISGTPISSGVFDFTVYVQDSNGDLGSKHLFLNIYPAPKIRPTSLPNGYVGVAYCAGLALDGASPSISWAIRSGALPSGLSLSYDDFLDAEQITGTPTVAGTFSFSVQVTDTFGGITSQSLSIIIEATAVGIATTSLPNGKVNTAYSENLTASGGTVPYTWSIPYGCGTLPDGLSLDSSTGVISGTPTRPGTFSFSVRVTSSLGSTAGQGLSINILL